MARYRRMDMEVSTLINLVHNRPELWDTSSAGYSERNTREEGWTYVCRGLYPEWDGMLEREQGVIENDVRNRWRTVRDCFWKQPGKKIQVGPLRHVAPPLLTLRNWPSCFRAGSYEHLRAMYHLAVTN
ncbi:uncharacterized protein LOC142740744 isoform X2 [Rhinoderma darwinii]|uniref:uncharacterized protein LOC142740744 isoform X2 n=1 Tax=Rhinoderma darwinii TaxID=43563 RepID=UPI003F6743F3